MRTTKFCLQLLGVVSCLALVGCPPTAKLSVSTTSLNFGTSGTSVEFTVHNSGSANTTLVFDVESDRPWLELDVVSGQSTGEDDPVTVTVTLNRDPDPAKADFNTGTITVTSSVGTEVITVAATPDYFTEAFEDDFDLENTTLIFTKNTDFGDDPSLDFYDAAIAKEVTSFVTAPAEGAHAIDFEFFGDPAFVPMPDATLELYGSTYDSFYVGSGGYVMFDNGTEAKAAATLEQHFDAPRISALGANLDPAQGFVSLLKTDDRIAVTYENMVDVDTGGVSNFQIELFFDGGVQITYLDIDALDSIAGLSAGDGLPSDFVETDLSAFNTGTVRTNTDSLKTGL